MKYSEAEIAEILPLLKTLADAEGDSSSLSPEEYRRAVDYVLHQIFTHEPLREVELDVRDCVAELMGRPMIMPDYIEPAYLSVLAKRPELVLEDYPTYEEVREYLAYKLADIQSFSADEQKLLSLIPELDEDRMITFPINEEFISKAAANPEALDQEHWMGLMVFINAKLFDREPLDEDENALLEYWQREEASDETIDGFVDESTLIHDNQGVPTAEACVHEYGYDIYNYNEMLHQLYIYWKKGGTMTSREKRVITRAWGFDPSDPDEADHKFLTAFREPPTQKYR